MLMVFNFYKIRFLGSGIAQFDELVSITVFPEWCENEVLFALSSLYFWIFVCHRDSHVGVCG